MKVAFERWQQLSIQSDAELWLRHLYETRGPLQEMNEWTTWDDAISYALARLVKLRRKGPKAVYYHGITTSSDCRVHQELWARLLEKRDLHCVVSMNYDLLVEQSLRRSYTKERAAPICYYGGYQFTQVVRKVTSLSRGAFELVQLGNEVVLYKMHGSLNWAWEKHSPTMKIHDDVRAVFRLDQSIGSCAIIPPLPEKQLPEEFRHVWREAERSLSTCHHWIVCGYSLPAYDMALVSFFERCAARQPNLRIQIVDPDSANLTPRWKSIASHAVIDALPGIPEAVNFL